MNRITPFERKWVLVAHLLFVVACLGHSILFLMFSLIALTTSDAQVLQVCYMAMHLVDRPFVPISALGMVVTGVWLSVRTHWGLFKHRWLIIKEVVTVACVVIGIAGVKGWTMKAITIVSEKGGDVLHNPELAVNGGLLLTGFAFQSVAMSALVAISVFKPWGRRSGRDDNK